MGTQIISVIIAVICTEAITQLIVHSEIFRPLRNLAENAGDFTGNLVNCGYCVSVWAAIPCAFFMAPLAFPSEYWQLNWFIWMLVIHRLSNFLDDFADRYLSNPIIEENPFSEADEHFGIIRDGQKVSQVPIDP